MKSKLNLISLRFLSKSKWYWRISLFASWKREGNSYKKSIR